jgi:hypothetical protein
MPHAIVPSISCYNQWFFVLFKFVNELALVVFPVQWNGWKQLILKQFMKNNMLYESPFKGTDLCDKW